MAEQTTDARLESGQLQPAGNRPPATPATSSKCKEVLEARIPSAVQSKNDYFLVKTTLEIPIFFSMDLSLPCLKSTTLSSSQELKEIIKKKKKKP